MDTPEVSNVKSFKDALIDLAFSVLGEAKFNLVSLLDSECDGDGRGTENYAPPETNQSDQSSLQEKLDSLKLVVNMATYSPPKYLLELDQIVDFKAFTSEAPPQSANFEAIAQIRESKKDSNQFVVPKS
ncbi:hypothetical protein SUGI_0097530 [Cryptomeria japonica]|nr:hypothetical protein SUGI_0097530 [Cryptomeria japonica]